MLFDFQKFIADLRVNEEKKEVVEKFEKYFGPVTGEIRDQNWYKAYVHKFKSVDYRVPDELKDDFDRVLLMELVASSFSSDGLVDTDAQKDVKEGEDANDTEANMLPEFVISVQSGDQVVVKKVSELRGFQILRLYEIYIEEQMNLQILIAEDDEQKEKEEEKNEKNAIMAQREAREHRRSIVLDNLDKHILTKQYEGEKAGKLDDLMGQL